MNWFLQLVFNVLRFFNIYDKCKYGYVDVVGAGEISVHIGDYHKVLEVRFEDEDNIPPPCGGGLKDTLIWNLRKHNIRHYHLDLVWSVQRPRRIYYVVAWR